MTFIDSNVSCGHWPFAQLPKRTLPQLESHLQTHGIAQALVSPLETLFLPDPDPANQALIRACRRTPSLTPVPVLNLANPDWRENLETYRQQTDLKAVKLYPNYHNYTLRSAACSELAQHLIDSGIRLIINARVVDERQQYHGLKIKGVSTKQLLAYANRFPDFRFLCTGLYRPEILEIAQNAPNISFDMSFADWHHLINELLETITPDRLFFGSHTPLMVTQANTYKLETANIPQPQKTQIAHTNPKTFFNL